MNHNVKFVTIRGGKVQRLSVGRSFGATHPWRRLTAIGLTISALLGLPQTSWCAEPIAAKWVATLSSEADPRLRQFSIASWSPRGRYLAGWSLLGRSVVVYDAQLGQLQEYGVSGRVRTIAWDGDGETLAALIQQTLRVWELVIWNIANGRAVATHVLPEDGLPEQCRFIAPRPLASAWVLLSRDGHSLWVGCSGPGSASTYPAAARFDLRTRVWSTIELTPARPDLRDSLHPQFFSREGRDLLFLDRVALDRSKPSEIWLAIVDVGTAEARNLPLRIATPRQRVFCTLPHLNSAEVTIAYVSVKEGRPVPTISNEVEADYEFHMSTVNLDRNEYTPPVVFDGVSGSGCQGLSLLPDRREVLFASTVDKGVYILDLDSGARVKLLPVADAIAVAVAGDGRRMAVQRRRVHDKSFITDIEIYSIE